MTNMPELIPQQQARGKLDALLLCSVRSYEDILTLFAAINSELGDNSPATLESRGEELLHLQEKAALADHALVATMQAMHPAGSDHPLMARRQDIMLQILSHNRSLISTINTIKSLLAHEIKEMQGGRVALNGYRQTATPSQSGGILNDAR